MESSIHDLSLSPLSLECGRLRVDSILASAESLPVVLQLAHACLALELLLLLRTYGMSSPTIDTYIPMDDFPFLSPAAFSGPSDSRPAEIPARSFVPVTSSGPRQLFSELAACRWNNDEEEKRQHGNKRWGCIR